MNSGLIKEIKKAYFKARKHKKWKTNTLQFSLEKNNFKNLASEIKKKNYQIKPSLCFISFLPIKREIFAGDFRDRVIHHYLFDLLSPLYDKLFINDCYSCREKKGTGYGIKRVKYFLKSATKNNSETAYILKLDISGYFMNIQRKKLFEINKKLIKKYFKNPELANNLLYLLKKVIFNNPIKNCKLRGKTSDWQGLPKNKSLFYMPDGKGLPIGNLTSQLFGNLYLNDFDHFVKEKLKCHYYGRYVDDIVIIHQDKNFLKNIIPLIQEYLAKNLCLKLHPKKIYLQEASHGLKFLGVIIKPNRIYIGKRVKNGFYQKIQAAAKGNLKNPAFFNSYLGMMKKYNTYRLRKKIMTASLTRKVLEKFQLEVNDDFSKVSPTKKIKAFEMF